jgi:NADH-quinone oxidoreductase subunit E
VNQLLTQYPQEVEAILARYPLEQKRSAVMPLLFLAQRATGTISVQAMEEIADICGISATDVASVVGFYTLFHDEAEGGGRYRIQVCTDLPCALRGAKAFLTSLCEALGIQPGETTPDGIITVEEVKCLAACHRAPMFQLQGDGEITYHENQTVDLALALVETLRSRQQAG